MNNIVENKVLPKQAPVCTNLKRELEEMLINLQDGIIPEEDKISALKKSFQQYNDQVREIKANKIRLEQQAAEKSRLWVEKQKQVTFNDILPTDSDDPFDTKNFEILENVRLIKNLVLQKLVPETHKDEHTQFIGYLMENGYIAKVTVKVLDEIREYHMLTSKGWHMLRQKNNMEAAKATDLSFGLPERLLSEPATWETEMFQQVAVLRKYYEEREISEFAVFTYGDEQMLFGCEIRNSYSVSYSFSACFVHEREKSETAALYKIAKSDKIDDLTVILLDTEEKKRLKLQRGLDTRTLNKLRYYVLSGEK